MAKKKTERPTLTPEQAAYVLEKLIEDRRVSTKDIQGYLARMNVEIAALESRIASLRAVVGSSQSTAVKAKPPTRKARARRRTAPALSPETIASRRLQGEYLRAINAIPKSQRMKFSKIAKEQGRAAISAMKKALAAKGTKGGTHETELTARPPVPSTIAFPISERFDV